MYFISSLYTSATAGAKGRYPCIRSQLFSGDLTDEVIGAAEDIHCRQMSDARYGYQQLIIVFNSCLLLYQLMDLFFYGFQGSFDAFQGSSMRLFEGLLHHFAVRAL